jgi:hypothetical protein
MKKVWKDIPGIPYQVADDGRVRNSRNGYQITTSDNGTGYIGFVSYDRGVEKFNYVHRCVMMAFSPVDGMDKLCVNHKDFDRRNNSLSNLEWVTRLQNQRHSLNHHRYDNANRNHSGWMKSNTSFLKMRKPVVLIKDTAIIECESATEAAKIVGVTLSTVARAARKEKEVKGFNAYYV